MAVSAKAFQSWRSMMAPRESTADLCRMAGIKRSTLAQQLVRGKVSETTVVRVARACDQDPVAALSYFEEYRDLLAGSRPPTAGELISQVSYICILQLLVARSLEPLPSPGELPSLCSYPHRNSVRAWFEAVDPGDLRQQLSARSGVAPQNLSAQLTAGRLATELAVEAARLAGVSLTSGLVATGLLTPDECGWPLNGRERALAELSDADLVFLARDRLDTLGKALKKFENDEKNNSALLEQLG
ncbi:hypothetical protein QNO08_00620 [Arthrobacter sp. zg-Y820]|uniref:hypothetical protein n=3 Tax=Arthrobacter TaxID=1663 RepID=UPI002540587B|nr:MULTISPECIES: hypothetical protein [unclassified Arthrobacter]MCC9197487.1 hypothetical protein [Arthrobacter sp. zg-Y820]MDK1280354.1 hypothetical protein [Arthrobacter sp. zg.Y820]MDK1360511.1 hypothetical protein [Arthrobacter sp. zg-Y1219]WIB09637.1 hypothetical protein QNO08_00620 [Arthrobacter sp. zg-Y820]